MSAPLVVNTADGTCWTRRTVTPSGLALYAPEGVCNCPEFVMATLSELAEHGIAGTADVLPVPVGPQMPDFPPPPRTELEKLHAERARLQGLLAEAIRDVHLARRERDLIRERVSEPYGCAHCGVVKRSHGRRCIGGAGMHSWERPADEQVKARMLARRVARMPLIEVPADRRERYAAALFEFVNGAFVWGACDDQSSWLSEADAAIGVADAEQAELRARVAELEAQREADHKTWQHDLLTARGEREATAARIAELEAAPTAVFRASHDSIVMGHYDSRQAAMDHVHGVLANEEGGDVTARVIWRADDPDADEPAWECWLFDDDMADDEPTGYVVTPLEVASEYDGEADEC